MRFPKNDTVRTTTLLENHAFLAPKINQEARRPDSPGHVVDHLGDAYLVLHKGTDNLAVYEECELVPELNAYWKMTYITPSGTPYSKEVGTYKKMQKLMKADLADMNVTCEGPFFSDKELEEGPEKTKNIFDHLTNNNDILQ